MPDSSGTLRVRAYTASGALPVASATVSIRGADENNRQINYFLTTDKDGLTKAVTLPAPLVSYSLNPETDEQPFSTYDLEISAPGYLDKRIAGLTIFSGVDSVQLINMIPGNSSNGNNIPNGNIDTVIPKNALY